MAKLQKAKARVHPPLRPRLPRKVTWPQKGRSRVKNSVLTLLGQMLITSNKSGINAGLVDAGVTLGTHVLKTTNAQIVVIMAIGRPNASFGTRRQKRPAVDMNFNTKSPRGTGAWTDKISSNKANHDECGVSPGVK